MIAKPLPAEAGDARAEFYARHSSGLDQFFSAINGETGLSILDLTGINQANVSFITNLGHRLYSEDYLRSLEHFVQVRGSDLDLGPVAVEAFLAENLLYPERSFDGVLLWDVLEYLEPPLLTATLERLHRITKPGGHLLAVFHSQERGVEFVQYRFRIRDARTLLLTPYGRRRTPQVFNNRTLERLFHCFGSLKFFLTRENLRELLVRK